MQLFKISEICSQVYNEPEDIATETIPMDYTKEKKFKWTKPGRQLPISSITE